MYAWTYPVCTGIPSASSTYSIVFFITQICPHYKHPLVVKMRSVYLPTLKHRVCQVHPFRPHIGGRSARLRRSPDDATDERNRMAVVKPRDHNATRRIAAKGVCSARKAVSPADCERRRIHRLAGRLRSCLHLPSTHRPRTPLPRTATCTVRIFFHCYRLVPNA